MIQLNPALTDFWGPIIFSVIGGPLLFPTKKIKEIYLTGLWISINHRRNSVGGGFVRAGFIFDQLPNRVCWIFHPNCLFSRWFLHFTVIIQDRLNFNTCPTRTDIDFFGQRPYRSQWPMYQHKKKLHLSLLRPSVNPSIPPKVQTTASKPISQPP